MLLCLEENGEESEIGRERERERETVCLECVRGRESGRNKNTYDLNVCECVRDRV